MIVVSGEIVIDPADREAALEATSTAVAATLEEEGCITYGFWADPGDESRFRVPTPPSKACETGDCRCALRPTPLAGRDPNWFSAWRRWG